MAERLETCLGHITKACLKCDFDDFNKQCPKYSPVFIRKVNVVDEDEYVSVSDESANVSDYSLIAK